MKKVLIIIGSARRGSSLHIGEFAKESLSRANVETEAVQLSNFKIDYCDGCLSCDETGFCHKTDDVAALLDRVKAADGVIFITPTRWSLLSGDIKVFMDRCNPLAGKDIFDSKKSLLVAVGQTNQSESVSIGRALAALRFFSDDAGFQCCGEFAFEECLTSSDILSKANDFSEFGKQIESFAIAILD